MTELALLAVAMIVIALLAALVLDMEQKHTVRHQGKVRDL